MCSQLVIPNGCEESRSPLTKLHGGRGRDPLPTLTGARALTFGMTGWGDGRGSGHGESWLAENEIPTCPAGGARVLTAVCPNDSWEFAGMTGWEFIGMTGLGL